MRYIRRIVTCTLLLTLVLGGEVGGRWSSSWRAAASDSNLPQVAEEHLHSERLPLVSPPSGTEAPLGNVRSVHAPAYAEPPAYKISINQDSIYQLSYGDLQATGLPVGTLDPRTFQLFNMGIEVALHVKGQADGRFDPGDAVLFYGEGLDTKYTGTNVYWLTYGKADGRRMETVDGSPSGAAPMPSSFATTLHVEENHQRDRRASMAPGDDRWYWQQILAAPGSAITQTVSFTLTHVTAEPFTATLRSSLHGRTHPDEVDPDHHARIMLNGNRVDDAKWDGFTPYTSEVDVPGSYLREGLNVIGVTAPLDTEALFDAFYTNWFEIAYRRTYTAEDNQLVFTVDDIGLQQLEVHGFSTPEIELFDIGDPLDVHRVVGATAVGATPPYTLTFQQAITDAAHFLALTPDRRLSPASIEMDAPSDLRDPSHGADYVLITHGVLAVEGPGERDDVYDLAEHRTAQGLRTMIVDVQEIYDAFSFGVFDPGAIRDFLTYAHEAYVPPAPSYVLLVGSGHYDFRGYASSEPTMIPAYLVDLGGDRGEVAADNRYAAVSGGDVLPDLAIGRLPVSTPAEAAVVIGKILAYEQDPSAGQWVRRGLSVADNQPDKLEQAGDFWDLSEALVSRYLPRAYAAERIYYDRYAADPVADHPDPPRPEPPYYASAEDAHAAILMALSDGALLAHYIGHGARLLWDHELLRETHVSALTNGGKLPVLLSMTCSTGDFAVPGQPCLDGSMLRAKGGGAVATWSCTAEGESAGHRYLDAGFFTAIFRDGVAEIGRAAMAGKRQLYESTGQFHDLIDTYTLLGDPATRLRALLVLRQRVYLPTVVRHD